MGQLDDAPYMHFLVARKNPDAVLNLYLLEHSMPEDVGLKSATSCNCGSSSLTRSSKDAGFSFMPLASRDRNG